MSTGRLEAFSDGVIAIIITIMVLELRVPHAPDMAALRPLFPVLLSYVLSFIYIGIYWNNHHHLMHAAETVSGAILWTNLLLLFWLSLVPFVTAWMGVNFFAPCPVFLYGVVLICSALAYYVLTRALVAHHGRNSALARALGDDFKGKISIVIYAVALPLCFWNPWVSLVMYALVAAIWFIPDRRLETRTKK